MSTEPLELRDANGSCHWESYYSNGFKFWRTECGANHVGSNSDSHCPTCKKQIVLSGFDAWWEGRKSYHP